MSPQIASEQNIFGLSQNKIFAAAGTKQNSVTAETPNFKVKGKF